MPIHEKFQRFKALHERGSAFVIPNPWDASSVRLLASLGFEALATTSAGYAFSKGKRDSFACLQRDEVLANATDIVATTDLPVSADLGNGFGAQPEHCADTIRLASARGLVGGSIEDATGDPAAPIDEFELAVDRVRAATQMAAGSDGADLLGGATGRSRCAPHQCGWFNGPSCAGGVDACCS